MESRDVRNRGAQNTPKASDDRYRFLLENSGDILWTVDLEGTWQFMTENVEKVAHIPLRNIIGKKAWDFVAPECVPVMKEKLRRRLRGEEIPPYEVIVIDGQGRRAPFEVKTSPIRNGKGQLIGIQGISRDITERKQAEKALRQAHAELERRVEERTRELAEAKSQAELYVDLMSHDINNMNMVAMGNLEMLQRQVAGDRNAVRLLSGALDMLKSSSMLIENVSKLQQAELGSLETKMVDLCEVLENVKKKYSKVPDRNVSINIRYQEANHCLVAANQLIEDVYSNLVGNAIKHALPGRPVVIDLTLSKTGESGKDYYRVEVEDNGPGIPDELKGRLFSRLERGKTKASGRGLGLYLVKTLVEIFRGKVWAEDRVSGEPGKGSRFVVLLPAAPD